MLVATPASGSECRLTGKHDLLLDQSLDKMLLLPPLLLFCMCLQHYRAMSAA
jgi:hypothetical protein